jgi:hypothetical protein
LVDAVSARALMRPAGFLSYYSYRGADNRTHVEVVHWRLPGRAKK